MSASNTTPSTQYEAILYEERDRIAIITLNRPSVLNALSARLLAEFDAALTHVERNPELRALIITGAGRAFSAGMDLNEGNELPPQPDEQYYRREFEPLMRRCLRLWELDKPVIAAVNGYALGHACDLCLMADLTIASENARFGLPEIRHGGGVATLIMPYVVGLKRAKELMLTGDAVSANEAWRIGLVNRVVQEKRLLEEAWALANQLASLPPDGLKLNKRAIGRIYENMGMREAMSHGLDILLLICMSMPREELEERAQLIAAGGLKTFLTSRDRPFETDKA